MVLRMFERLCKEYAEARDGQVSEDVISVTFPVENCF